MKTAIVTGASGNLGQAVIKKLIDGGYKVIGTVIPNDPIELDFSSGQFEKVVVDLLNEDAAREFIGSVIEKHKRIDVIVLTVGGFAMGKVVETKTSDILKQYKLNFETTYNVARPVFVHMMQQGMGRIFIIGSKPGLEARYGKGMAAYSLSKSLIFRLAELMNEEAKGSNVVTSVIVPSTIDTPQNRQSMPEAKHDTWVKPEQIAHVIQFYSDDASSVIREPVIKVYNNA